MEKNDASDARRAKLITGLSAVIEFYDFSLILVLAPVLGKLFYPDNQSNSHVMPVLLVFLVGYLARCAGGLVYSYHGDKNGRKKSVISSVVGMSLATLAIALLPVYSVWGVAAQSGFFLLRFIQGFFMGGEVPGSLVYATEFGGTNQRGGVVAYNRLGYSVGYILCLVNAGLLQHWLTEEQFLSYGWRLLFLFGAIAGLISFWLRLSMKETPVFLAFKTSSAKPHTPILSVLKHNQFELFAGLVMTMTLGVILAVFLYLHRYLFTYIGMAESQAYWLALGLYVFNTLCNFIVSLASDRFGRVPLMRYGAIGIIVFAPPAFLIMSNHLLLTTLSLCIVAFAGALILGSDTIRMELFPTGSRYSGMALCHNIGLTLSAGTVPALLESLSARGFISAPGILMALFCGLLLWVLRYCPDIYNKSLSHTVTSCKRST